MRGIQAEREKKALKERVAELSVIKTEHRKLLDRAQGLNEAQESSAIFFEQYTPQIQHEQSCTARSHFITRTRVAQELQSSRLHIFVSLSQPPSTCHVSFLAAPDTDQAQVLFHPFHPLLL